MTHASSFSSRSPLANGRVVELISQDESHVCGGLGNALITIWRDTPTAEATAQRVPWLHRTLKVYPAVGLLVVGEASAQKSLFPSRKFSAESKRQLELFTGQLSWCVSVVEGEGIMQSLARTLIRRHAQLSKGRTDFQYRDTVRDAARWLGGALVDIGGPSGGEILQASSMLREGVITAS